MEIGKWKYRKYYFLGIFIIYVVPIVYKYYTPGSDWIKILLFELVCFFLYILVSLIYLSIEPEKVVKPLIFFAVILFMFLYVRIHHYIKDLNYKSFYRSKNEILESLTNKIKQNSNIRYMKVLRREYESKYNQVNKTVLLERPEQLLDSLQIDKEKYNSLKAKMLEAGVTQFSYHRNGLELTRIISMWGDEGWLYIMDNDEIDKRIVLEQYKNISQVADNWYYWYED